MAHDMRGGRPVMSDTLTGRELEILGWIAMGKTNPEIGSILEISLFTVKNHIQRIFRKLNVSNRAQAVAMLKNDG
jgi:DNA-binding CsgD family transcriptional regulator